MRAKSVLLLVIALGCGVVASVAVSQVVLDQKGQGEVQTVGILVVSKEISASAKITPESVRIEQWPLDRVPPGSISDPKLIEQKFTKQRLYPGEPIIEAKLSSKGKEFTVPYGYRIFDITVRDESGGGGYIGPGDLVDVFGFFEKGRINTSTSVKVMENLEVVMIDGVAVVDPEASAQKKSSTIQLLVKDSQYVVLDTAANLGKLRLALRPPQAGDASRENRMDDGEKFMSWLKESEKSHVEREIAEPVAVAPLEQQPSTNHEMLIISPTKSSVYRWTEGQSLPQKIEQNSDGNNSQSSGYQAQSYSSDQSAAPVNPANSVQPNMTWDPVSGKWQSGGFKATYPTSK
jgi:pilus assembly protein CpaB